MANAVRKLAERGSLLEVTGAPVVRVTRTGEPTFGQVYDWLVDNGYLVRLSHAALKAYLVIIRHKGRSGKAWPGQRAIATLAGIGHSTVKPALAELVALGLIEVIRQGQGRQSALYEVVEIPAGAVAYRPDFASAPETQFSAPEPLAAESSKTADTGLETAKTAEKQGETAGSATKYSQGNRTTNRGCLSISDSEKNSEGLIASPPVTSVIDISAISEDPGISSLGVSAGGTGNQSDEVASLGQSQKVTARANRHTRHALQVAADKGRSWDRSVVFEIMAKLCRTHDDQTITRAIQEVGPVAKTPGLIRGVILKKPTAAQKAAVVEAKRKQAAAADEEKRREIAGSVFVQKGREAEIKILREIRERIAAQPGPVTNSPRRMVS